MQASILLPRQLLLEVEAELHVRPKATRSFVGRGHLLLICHHQFLPLCRARAALTSPEAHHACRFITLANKILLLCQVYSTSLATACKDTPLALFPASTFCTAAQQYRLHVLSASAGFIATTPTPVERAPHIRVMIGQTITCIHAQCP